MDTLFAKTSFFTIFKRNNEIFSQFSKEMMQFFSQFSKETTQFFTIGLVPDPFTILEKKTADRPIDSLPSCPGLHDLRIACLKTYYNMKAISLHYNITDQLSD